MKKMISIALILAVLSSMVLVPGVYAFDISEYDNVEAKNFVRFENFVILGTEYFDGMEVIEERSQLDHSLIVKLLDIDKNKISFDAILKDVDGEEISLSADGMLYTSKSEKLKKVNGMTAILNSNDCEVLSCIFENETDGADLFPVNVNLDGKDVMRISIKIDSKVYYFEGELPIEFEYDTVYSEMAQASSQKKDITLNMQNKVYTLNEEDVVKNQEIWRYSMRKNFEPVEVDMVDFEKEIQKRTTYPSELSGVKSGVFVNAGEWASVNNPSAPQIGYYATTYSVSGTNNYVTEIMKWEYLYNPCDNIVSGTNVGGDGSTGVKIITAAEYTYYAVRDSVELTNNFVPYKIKNSAVVMGLFSDEQILSGVNREVRSNGSKLTVNWSSILGLLPFGKAYSTISTVFSSIQYYNTGKTSPSETYQATASGQKNAYGKLIRGHKLTDNGNDLVDENDCLIIKFTVRQPTDLSRTSRWNNIGNKYYFEIYERNAYTLLYTTKVYTVDQMRESAYSVQ